jgi:hypothetical protein
VVGSRPDICLISDRHSGILAAIRQLKEGSDTHIPVWPDVRNRWCMRHMGANFYNHFRNKDLMNLFKRLCQQNQQRKFNALWKVLDDLTTKYLQTGVGSSSNASSSQSSSSRPFSNWIQDAPKEKWALLYDTDGSRYGIMTTNLTEIYNNVLRGVRGLPLVGIVEFILYGCSKYFIKRYNDISVTLQNPSILYGNRVAEYMRTKISKAAKHHMTPMGTMDMRFEVGCKDRLRRGVRRERVVQECLLRGDGSASCTCHKSRLLHLPCSHVIAACAEIGMSTSSFVSTYFKNETIAAVWT